MALGQLSFPTAKAHSVVPEMAQTSPGFASDRDGFGRADRDGWRSRLAGPVFGDGQEWATAAGDPAAFGCDESRKSRSGYSSPTRSMGANALELLGHRSPRFRCV